MKKIIKNNVSFLKFMVSYSPSYLIISLIVSFFTLYDTYVSVLLLKYILDGIENKIPLFEMIIFMVTVFSVGLIINIINSWCSNIFFPRYGHGFKKYMHNILFEKALSLDLKSYDDPEFLNEYVWTMNDADQRVFSVFASFQNFLISIINIAFLVVIIITLDFWLILFTLAAVFFSSFFSTKLSGIHYKLNVENISPIRTINYVQRVLYMRDYAKDLRLSAVPSLIKKMFNDASESLINNVNRFGFKMLIWDVILKICVFLFSVLGILLYLTIRTYQGIITLGSFPALFNATTILKDQLQSLFKIIPSAYENNLYIERFYKFMSYKPEQSQGEAIIDSINKIEFRSVFFSYDYNHNVINDINYSIQKGDKIAIVGQNGAGKTTLTDLLLKLYYPSSGQILVNDKNINDYNTTEYLKKFCVVTQDFKLYAISIAENILFKEDISEVEKEKIINSLKNVDLYNKIILSPHGINSQYTKEFDDDGLLFSGGEEQKLAISKIFASNAEIIILDEPSSALDPVSEYNIFNEIMKQLKDKTIIFISHRLYSTTLADKIIVLDNGRICEFGNHKSLMKEGGRYAEMYRIQSERFLND